MSIDYKAEINRLKKALEVTVVAHYYQRDEVFEMADILGDSLELARRCQADTNPGVVWSRSCHLPMLAACRTARRGSPSALGAAAKPVIGTRSAEHSIAGWRRHCYIAAASGAST